MKRIQAVLCKPESTASSSVNRDFRQQFHSGAYIVLSSCLQIQKNLVSVLKTIVVLWLDYDHKMLKKAHSAQASLWARRDLLMSYVVWTNPYLLPAPPLSKGPLSSVHF